MNTRPLTLTEAEKLVDWARVEGWNPGLADAPALYAADPAGFIGCFIEGKMAAGISAVRYGSDFGFIGLYIAHPDFRGQGLGRKVWDAGMAHLEGRTIGLDGVPEQQDNYRSMGFEPAYQTFRWSGRLQGSGSSEIVAFTAEMLPELISYDRNFFPSGRDTFLDLWLVPPRVTKVLVRKGRIAGYAVCRECHDGFKTGPLFADDGDAADALLRACAVDLGGQTLHIDVPEAQVSFAQTLESLGFSKGFVTCRMYRGPAPVMHMPGVFGITTLELG
jgi:GNAT superfamily N-acetyltransferase